MIKNCDCVCLPVCDSLEGSIKCKQALKLVEEKFNKQIEATEILKELVEYRKTYYSVDVFFRGRDARINAVIKPVEVKSCQ